MKLYIDDDTTINKIKQDFNAHFPYLKLEFFKKPYRENENYPAADIIDSNTLVNNCRTMGESGVIVLSDKTTVKDLENEFHDRFGLSIQVFRKAGNIWLETTFTDNWTLERQNHEGEEASQFKGLKNNGHDARI